MEAVKLGAEARRDVVVQRGLRRPAAKVGGAPRVPHGARRRRRSLRDGAARRAPAGRCVVPSGGFPPTTCNPLASRVEKPARVPPPTAGTPMWADRLWTRGEQHHRDAACAPQAGLRRAESRRNRPTDAPVDVAKPWARAFRWRTASLPVGRAIRGEAPILRAMSRAQVALEHWKLARIDWGAGPL
jgi:hypothetical protein